MQLIKSRISENYHKQKSRFWNRIIYVPLIVSALFLSCNRTEEARQNIAHSEIVQIDRPTNNRISKCYDELFDDGFPEIPHMKIPSKTERRLQMEKEMANLYRRIRVGSAEETYENYLSYLETVTYSTGELIYPNAATALEGMDVFSDEREKTIAARRVVKTLLSQRIEHTYDLLYYMPQTAIVMLDAINRRESMMQIEDSEDMAMFFLLLIGSQRRVFDSSNDVPEKGLLVPVICERFENNKIKRMTTEQLHDLDSYYAERIVRFAESKTTCVDTHDGTWQACNVESNSWRNLCENVRERNKNSELINFGISRFEFGTCTTKIRQDVCGSPHSLAGRMWEWCRVVAEKRGLIPHEFSSTTGQ